MTIAPTLRALILSMATLSSTAIAQEPSAVSAPAQEVRYLPLEQLRSFYKLMPRQSGRKGVSTVSNAGTVLELGPGMRELSIGGYRWQLSHPLKDDGAGDLLISEVDMVKLIDPVLRPSYIAERRLVRTVVIDPGHGGYNTGATGDYVHEADFTMQLAHELQAQLTKRGYTVVLTHEQNRYMSDQQRIACANGADAAIFISLHLNCGRSDIQGIETYTAAPDAPGAQQLPAHKHDAANAALAFAVHSSLVAATGAQDGACRRAQYSLLNSIDCPAIMVLAGYATHKDEGSKLATPEYRTKLAEAITEGVSTFARAINPDAKLEPQPEVVPEPAKPEPVAAPAPQPVKPKPKAKASNKKPAKSNKRRNNRSRR